MSAGTKIYQRATSATGIIFSKRGYFVLAQGCAVVEGADKLYPKSQMPLKEGAMCDGIKELVYSASILVGLPSKVCATQLLSSRPRILQTRNN